MAIISNGTTVVSGGGLSISVTPPTSLGAIGTYACMRNDGSGNNNNLEPGETASGSWLAYCNTNNTAYVNTSASGTWRTMGWAGNSAETSNNGYRTTMFVRIS